VYTYGSVDVSVLAGLSPLEVSCLYSVIRRLSAEELWDPLADIMCGRFGCDREVSSVAQFLKSPCVLIADSEAMQL
jgi:hypothetical protein